MMKIECVQDAASLEAAENISAMVELKKIENDHLKKHVLLQRYFREKFNAIRVCDMHVHDIRMFIKVLRHKLGLKKTPKKKGYEYFLTDEEKRLEKMYIYWQMTLFLRTLNVNNLIIARTNEVYHWHQRSTLI